MGIFRCITLGLAIVVCGLFDMTPLMLAFGGAFVTCWLVDALEEK